MFEFWQVFNFIIEIFQKDHELNPGVTTRRRLTVLLVLMALIVLGFVVHMAWGILHHHPSSPFPHTPKK